MSPTTTKTLEHLALDGPIGLSVAIVLGAALLALFAWSLWREHGILGRRQTVLFCVLRAVALATVLWMLLAPTNVRVEQSTTRRAVAIATDVSGSMHIDDSAGTSHDLQWAVAGSEADKSVATRATDKAIAALGMARRYLQRANTALQQHEPESTVVEAAVVANRSIQRARSHLQRIRDASNKEKTEKAELRSSQLSVLGSSLSAPEFQRFDRLCRALRRDRTPSQKDWRESLPDLEHRIAGIRRSLRELARQVAAEERSTVAQENPALLATVSGASRLDRASAFLERLQDSALASVAEKADVRWHSFDRKVYQLVESGEPRAESSSASTLNSQPSTLDSSATVGTDIAAALEELRRGRDEQPLAAVFLLSDMAHNQPGESDPREVAATLGETPVYVVPVGDTRHARDVILQDVTAPTVAMRNDDIVIEVSLQAYDCAGEVCAVQLLRDGEVIDFRQVAAESGFLSRTVRFERRMRSVGNAKFQVAVKPLSGELTEDNNYDEFEVNVTRSDIEVLLADELPRWEYRYLAQLFRRDPKVAADELLFHPRVIATGRREQTQAVPVTVDEWDRYDVVLLGDLPPERLPVEAQKSLVDYLQERGGTLVLIAGRNAMPQAYGDHPLEEILPVVPADGSPPAGPAGYAFQVTAEGRDHNALMVGESEEETRRAWEFVNRFAPLHQLSTWRRPRPSARTLISAVPRNSADVEAAAGNNAFLCWQPVGRGRVVYLSGPETYRLRFLRGDRLHYRFWGQMLRWAIASDLSAGTRLVRIRTDKTRYEPREAVQATVRLRDADGEPVVAEDLEVRVTSGEDERTAPLAPVTGNPGEYTADIRSLPAGVYRIEPAGAAVDELQADSEQEPASASFTVRSRRPPELADTRCDRALAQQIAETTGGQVLPPTAVAEVLELTDLEPLVSERIERRPLWVQWEYLWLVFGCLHVEWAIRKWKGLS